MNLDTARYAYEFYRSRGLPAHVAAGIVGNLAVESDGFDSNVIAGTRLGDSGKAKYIQQLRGGRQTNYEAWTKANGLEPNSLDAQLGFVLEELDPKSPYRDVIAASKRDAILGSRTAQEASDNFMTHYERPNPDLSHSARRVGIANSLSGQGTEVASLGPVSTPGGAGALNFAHPEQSGIAPDMADALTGAGAEIGRDLNITSGYRSPAHNHKVGGARGSYHTRGEASDVNMAGWTPQTRQDFVREMTQRGAGGFITYTDSPDMLHVDMRSRPDGQTPHFMHDRSAGNMPNAPEWMKESQLAGGLLPPADVPIPAQRPDPNASILPTLQYPDTAPADLTPFPQQAPPGALMMAQTPPPMNPTPAPVNAPAMLPGTLVAQASAAPAAPAFLPKATVGTAPSAGATVAAAVPTDPQSGLSGILSGLVSAIAGGQQRAAEVQAAADRDWNARYVATLGPSPAELAAQMPMDVARIAPGMPMLPAREKAVPQAPNKDDILASLFGPRRASTSIMG